MYISVLSSPLSFAQATVLLLSILMNLLSLVSLVVLSGGDAGLRDGCGCLALVHIDFSLSIKDFHLTGLLLTPLFTPALQRRTCLLQVLLC